uniref:G-protein coupled receptors family 1 profile domain-containing protein n=1 Tax=Romanomermis culicivorax TaxID=13658 RepID=A0A915L580_ROMCU
MASSFTVWFTLDFRRQIPALCFPETYMTPFHTYYHYSFNALAGVLSCAIGVMVAVVYCSKKKSLTTTAAPPFRSPSVTAIGGGGGNAVTRTIIVGQGGVDVNGNSLRGSGSGVGVTGCSVRRSVFDDRVRASVISIRQQQEVSSMMSKELRLSITMLVIGILDMVLVVMPHVLMTVIKMGNYRGDTASYLNYAAGFLIGFRCLVSIFVYFGFNTDFRLAMLRMFMTRRTSIAPQ